MVETFDKNTLYNDAYCNTAKKLRNKPGDHLLIKRAVLYWIKFVNTLPNEVITREQIIRVLRITKIIRNLMARLTPEEFENVFPITKIYDGDKTQTKDYFYAKDFMRSLTSDEPIGEFIEELLCEYCNGEITLFVVNLFNYINRLLEMEGSLSFSKSFYFEHGI